MRAPRMEQATQPMTNGMSTNPAWVALLPITAWRYSGTKAMAPNMAMPERKPVAAAARTIGLAKSPSGTTGSAACRSIITKSTSSTTEKASNPTTEGLHQTDQERRDGHGEDACTAIVEGRGAPCEPLAGQPPPDGGHGKKPEGQVDVEDPAPRDGVGQEPADQRTHERGHAPDSGEVPLHLRAALEAIEVVDDGHADGDERARAQPLDGAKRDQLGHALGEAGQ